MVVKFSIYLNRRAFVMDFQSYQNELDDLKGNKNIICTMLKYRETFYGLRTTLNPFMPSVT